MQRIRFVSSSFLTYHEESCAHTAYPQAKFLQYHVCRLSEHGCQFRPANCVSTAKSAATFRAVTRGKRPDRMERTAPEDSRNRNSVAGIFLAGQTVSLKPKPPGKSCVHTVKTLETKYITPLFSQMAMRIRNIFRTLSPHPLPPIPIILFSGKKLALSLMDTRQIRHLPGRWYSVVSVSLPPLPPFC